MISMPQPEATPGYAAARLDGTTILIDLLAVSDIKNDADTMQHAGGANMLQYNSPDFKPISLSGSLQSIAEGRRPQVLVLKADDEKFALGCNEIRVIPANKVSLQPLRSCMNGPESLLTKIARIGETTAFYCDAAKLGALIKRLLEQEHGKLESNPD